MNKEFCHLCKEGGKQCVNVNESQEYAMLATHLKCASCGKPLA
ncbi:hypothetical protein [Candidatus Nitrosotenuis cloacae]|nr:hypothetical protein [Candidatus Nitrosotenuis cloacae]